MSRVRAILSCLPLLAVACAGPVDDSTPLAAEQAALEPVTSLAGEWRVAGIDGKPFDEPYGLALSANAHEIWWEPRCFGLVRTYAVKGTRLTISPPAPGAQSPPGSPAPHICTIAPPPAVNALRRALDAAETVGRTPENGVLLSGNGHSLLLFSQ